MPFACSAARSAIQVVGPGGSKTTSLPCTAQLEAFRAAKKQEKAAQDRGPEAGGADAAVVAPLPPAPGAAAPPPVDEDAAFFDNLGTSTSAAEPVQPNGFSHQRAPGDPEGAPVVNGSYGPSSFSSWPSYSAPWSAAPPPQAAPADGLPSAAALQLADRRAEDQDEEILRRLRGLGGGGGAQTTAGALRYCIRGCPWATSALYPCAVAPRREETGSLLLVQAFRHPRRPSKPPWASGDLLPRPTSGLPRSRRTLPPLLLLLPPPLLPLAAGTMTAWQAQQQQQTAPTPLVSSSRRSSSRSCSSISRRWRRRSSSSSGALSFRPDSSRASRTRTRPSSRTLTGRKTGNRKEGGGGNDCSQPASLGWGSRLLRLLRRSCPCPPAFLPAPAPFHPLPFCLPLPSCPPAFLPSCPAPAFKPACLPLPYCLPACPCLQARLPSLPSCLPACRWVLRSASGCLQTRRGARGARAGGGLAA